MPMTPEAFTNQYLPITFNGCVGKPGTGEIMDGPVTTVYIRSYLNANNRKGPPPKDNPKGPRPQKDYEEGKGMPFYEMKDQVLQFLNARRKAKTFGIRDLLGSFYCPGVNPYIACQPTWFMHAFTGKIGPAALRQVLPLISYFYDQSPAMQHRYPSLQNFADRCLGLDCNGLVGAYFESEYPTLGIVPNSDISSYERENRTIQGKAVLRKGRTSLKELASRDVIIFPNYHHIAIISSITMLSVAPGTYEPNAVVCRVSQSRSAELGGATTSELTIVKEKQGFRFQGGGEYFKSIVQVAPEGG